MTEKTEAGSSSQPFKVPTHLWLPQTSIQKIKVCPDQCSKHILIGKKLEKADCTARISLLDSSNYSQNTQLILVIW